jgi:hypothetical protein
VFHPTCLYFVNKLLAEPALGVLRCNAARQLGLRPTLVLARCPHDRGDAGICHSVPLFCCPFQALV